MSFVLEVCSFFEIVHRLFVDYLLRFQWIGHSCVDCFIDVNARNLLKSRMYAEYELSFDVSQ
jgi:hypothetical protein